LGADKKHKRTVQLKKTKDSDGITKRRQSGENFELLQLGLFAFKINLYILGHERYIYPYYNIFLAPTTDAQGTPMALSALL